MRLTKAAFKRRKGNSIEDVKARLLTTFSIIALSTSFLVFFAFSIRLVLHEDRQIEEHLASFKDIAIRHYHLEQVEQAMLSRHVTAYYNADALPDKYQPQRPFESGKVSRFRSYDFGGYMVYHQTFDYEKEVVPLYLTIDARAIDFGDDSWDTLMLISMLLMVFLIFVLRFSLKRVFDGLMSPISELSQQLNAQQGKNFTTSEFAIDELKQLTQRLNSYTKMKERVARQELMFAKYASHELKTPIAVVLCAANLQAMKEDPEFQLKQRQRILRAATGMQETVEVLLNIVKQENALSTCDDFPIYLEMLDLDEYRARLNSGVELKGEIAPGSLLNIPHSVLTMVLKNLIDNAIRFTHSGVIWVRISSNRIEVQDTGVGLSETPDTEHGLGLLIVERICQSYGWEFKLQDNPKQPGCLAVMLRLQAH